MNKRKAVITGVAGQDGSYLAELLLEKGYEVYGMIPRRSSPETQTLRLDHITSRLHLEYGDVLDMGSLLRTLKEVQPDEVYHLAAQSHVQVSFMEPVHTTSVIVLGTVNRLEAVAHAAPRARVYNAASSEMFGNTPDLPSDEESRMVPCSPYATAKLNAYHLSRVYRVSRRMFVSNGILFNHESPRRGLNFVTAKIVKGALDIKAGRKEELVLGNLKSSRDWGHARDYVRAMWMMLQHEAPDDFLVATGVETTVQEFLERVFRRLGIPDPYRYVKISPRYIRPYEVNRLRGNPAKIQRILGWKPTFTLDDLINDMIEGLSRGTLAEQAYSLEKA
ncbi:MAG: GDP-mannose 4,6-dehydratase [Candidatus Omnitrophica bacterium]|nr:GDP-mannose 4,6-dehydratase [Candidatus Omnitrophota bacterium]